MRCLLSGERLTLETEIYIHVRLKAKSLGSKHRQYTQGKKEVCLRAAWAASARETGQNSEQAAGKAKDDGEEDWSSILNISDHKCKEKLQVLPQNMQCKHP